MKKVIVLVAAILIIGTVLTSCSSSCSCPAYNTYDKYKIENMY